MSVALARRGRRGWGRPDRSSPTSADPITAWRSIGQPAAETESTMASLQASVGNRAVQRLVEGGSPGMPRERDVATDRHSIAVMVPRGERSTAGPPAPGAPQRVDAPPGEEERDVAAAIAAVPLQAPGTEPGAAPEAQATPAQAAPPESTPAEPAPTPTPEPAPTASTPEAQPTSLPPAPAPVEAPVPAGGEHATKLPDIQHPALEEIGKSDGVFAGLGYSGSTNKGGAAPSGFGVTRSFNCSLRDISVTSVGDNYLVTATVVHPVTYQIRSGTGPDGQRDIAGAADADITAANHATVEFDLTPDMSDLNGRPPRTQFWSEDLTERHELVHCADDRANAPGVVAQIAQWMSAQTVGSWIGVYALLGQVPSRFATGLMAALSTEAGEKHAYGDGAASYTARVDAIKAKAAAGGYP